MSCFPKLITSLLTIESKFLKLVFWAVPVILPAGVHASVWAGPVT